jgi:hypothetical protein
VQGSAGEITGLSLRLYEAAAGRWTLHYANLANGELTTPMVGSFENGRGEFYGDDTLEQRPIRVRFLIVPQGRDVCRFEQAFSADRGRTWEVNWVAVDVRQPN